MSGVPGSGGPVPKATAQRRRRNKTDVPVTDSVPAGRDVESSSPRESSSSWHPLAREWYDSLASSGQARLYEPSDWAEARVCAELMSRLFQADKPSAQLAQTVLAWTTTLMTTEGSRRRLRLELARGPQVDEDEVAADATVTDLRSRLGG